MNQCIAETGKYKELLHTINCEQNSLFFICSSDAIIYHFIRAEHYFLFFFLKEKKEKRKCEILSFYFQS